MGPGSKSFILIRRVIVHSVIGRSLNSAFRQTKPYLRLGLHLQLFLLVQKILALKLYKIYCFTDIIVDKNKNVTGLKICILNKGRGL